MNAPLKYLLDLGERRQKHKEDRKMEKKIIKGWREGKGVTCSGPGARASAAMLQIG